MKRPYLSIDPWKIIENGFSSEKVKSSESIFSLGNGAMGQRANFEESYSGTTFQGSYIGGVYYPDKTRVGWWKNGYPEYFAKVLNAPSWIGIHFSVNGTPFDLNTCVEVSDFKRELDMQKGLYTRSFEAQLSPSQRIGVEIKRFLSLDEGALGVIHYSIKAIKGDCDLAIDSFVDGHIKNQDSNWDDPFWDHKRKTISKEFIALHSQTLKTEFDVFTYASSHIISPEGEIISDFKTKEREWRLSQTKEYSLSEGQQCVVLKFGGYVTGMHHAVVDFEKETQRIVTDAKEKGFETLFKEHESAWQEIWAQSDIQIEGDDMAQQAIRYNIFQLNQTYNGKDARLNIGPKGFTGEKYGGSTYWDTEAYCIPFYMATKDKTVARNLLKYRYDQLDKAIENASKLGFNRGAALYPMVTMNGEECHNEWEITFEEIHRNGAIAYAIFNYERFTGDTTYIPEMGLEVLIGIARFWSQRVQFSQNKNAYVILGVTGPNEYENNINNNWYTNYLGQWCLQYTKAQVDKISKELPHRFAEIKSKLNWNESESSQWETIANQMYFPKHPDQDLFLQQDGFLDKDLIPAKELLMEERPINQHWSWDRILRSPYIKQADVLQGFYFFQDHFQQASLKRHFDFYEPLTVHESSLSSCVHSILAARLGEIELAYTFYLQTSRLDLDDYNKEVEEGLHITSMAGTWMSIVEGFGGVQVINNELHVNPILPDQWKSYSFKINFRGNLIEVCVSRQKTDIRCMNKELIVYCDGKAVRFKL